MIDPKLQYCQCGHTFKFSTWHKVWMLLFQEYSYRCPCCHSVMKFRLMNHIVKVETKVIKNRDEVWRNG